MAEGKKEKTKINTKNLHSFLGPPPYLPDEEQKRNEVGLATGLAWTETGGEILHIEASTTPGKGSLILTGHLGDVMKESAQAALTYARSKGKSYRIHPNTLNNKEIHIHVPAGAIPKDGPSAGVTMFVALTSLLTNKPVRSDVAMTGEITLRGLVLPVGGIKEKVLAGMRAGIRTIILPKKNEKDLEEIPEHIRNQMNFKFIQRMDEAIELALKHTEPRSAEREVVSPPVS